MNFRNIMILIGVAVAVTLVAGVMSPDPEIRRQAAASLIDMGKIVMGAAIGVLGPQLRSIGGGERVTDPPPYVSYEAKPAEPRKGPDAR